MIKLDYAMSNGDYHAMKGHLSASALKELNKSPAHYKVWLNQEPSQTPAMRWGSLAHTWILEPDTIQQRYHHLAVPMDKRTKAYKEEKALAEADGKELVDTDEWLQLCAMRDAVRSNKYAQALLAQGKPEVTALWGEGDLLCRARADWFDARMIVDLKTTKDAQPDAFSRQAYSLGYYLQAAWYVRGFEQVTGERPKFFFIAAEKEPPYAVTVHQATEELLHYGERCIERLLIDYRNCQETGEWYGYDATPTIHELTLPAWAK